VEYDAWTRNTGEFKSNQQMHKIINKHKIYKPYICFGK
jgi:hypothetical protein